jgi:sugar O-acyltransferase (sialic acid O-acetyltransferase NeuD family)
LTKPLLILGSGGHASVLVDILLQQNRTIVGVVSPSIELKSLVFANIPHFLNDDDVLNFNSTEIKLVNGIGSLPGTLLRAKLFERFTEYGYEFETIIASSSSVSRFSNLAEGAQVLHGAIIQTGALVGKNSIVNTGSQIDHDCTIGRHSHLAPGVILSGGVYTGKYVHFGTNSGAIHNIKIGDHAVIGAGATVTSDIPENTVCYPAKNTYKETSRDES